MKILLLFSQAAYPIVFKLDVPRYAREAPLSSRILSSILSSSADSTITLTIQL